MRTRLPVAGGRVPPRIRRVSLAGIGLAVLSALLTLPGCGKETEQEPLSPILILLPSTTRLTRMDVSADGRHLLVVTQAGIEVWDLWTQKRLWELAKRSAILSDLGGLVLVYSYPNDRPLMELRQVRSGALLASLEGDPVAWRSPDMAFSHDGKRLAIRHANLEVALYELGDLEFLSEAPAEAPTLRPRILRYGESRHEERLSRRAIGFSADDRQLFLLSNGRQVLQRWSLDDPPALLGQTRFGHTHAEPGRPWIIPQDLTADGELGWSCDFLAMRYARFRGDLVDYVWRVELHLEPSHRGHSYSYASACAISPDRRWLALGPRVVSGDLRIDYLLGLWSSDGSEALIERGSERQTTLSDAQVAALRFSPDSQYLYVVDEALGMHRYQTGVDPLVERLSGPKAGFGGGTFPQPMLASTDHGVAWSHSGAHRIAWWPVSAAGSGEGR